MEKYCNNQPPQRLTQHSIKGSPCLRMDKHRQTNSRFAKTSFMLKPLTETGTSKEQKNG